MREILFRAKQVNNGEWVEGYFAIGKWYLDEKERYAILPIDLCFYPHCEINEWIEIDPETVCQYTGMIDKNGKRIWENDIVDASGEWWDAFGPAGHDSPIINVEWIDELTGFDPFANYDCDCDVYIDASGCEVIGNIFDNPELLKGE